MENPVLKKQFQKRDVERLRNLIKGKQGNRTTLGIGYGGETQEDHKEGDIWEHNGKTWTIKDGIKENITKLDKFKKASVPLFCPDCKQIMDAQLDPFYFKSYGHCIGCRATFETKLKLEGKWEAYCNEIYNKEIDHQIEEYKEYIKDLISDNATSYISEAGDIQKWVGGIDKKRAENSLGEVIEYLNSLKK
jgi:hypothetical protein